MEHNTETTGLGHDIAVQRASDRLKVRPGKLMRFFATGERDGEKPTKKYPIPPPKPKEESGR